MRYEEFLTVFQRTPIIDSGMLAAFGESRGYRALQLSRWVREGKLIQLRRGFYIIAPPFQKENPSPYLVANTLHHPSYVSLQSALAEYGLIPEAVPVITSVTAGRPGEWETPVGTFRYRHIRNELFFGYRNMGTSKRPVFVATPEKAVLDLMYFIRHRVSPEWMDEMRFQHLEVLSRKRLLDFAGRFESAAVSRAARLFLNHRKKRTGEFTEEAFS